MQNFHSQRTGAADAAGEVLLSLVVELSESEALPLALTHFCLCHLAAALLRLYAFAESRSLLIFLGAGMPCVWNFFGCQSGGLPRFVHLGMVLLVLQGFGRCAMWGHKKLLQLRWMEGLGAGEKRWFHGASFVGRGLQENLLLTATAQGPFTMHASHGWGQPWIVAVLTCVGG